MVVKGAHPVDSNAVVIPFSFAARNKAEANSGWQSDSPPERVKPPPELR